LSGVLANIVTSALTNSNLSSRVCISSVPWKMVLGNHDYMGTGARAVSAVGCWREGRGVLLGAGARGAGCYWVLARESRVVLLEYL
jgi:hypothetical protein